MKETDIQQLNQKINNLNYIDFNESFYLSKVCSILLRENITKKLGKGSSY